MDLDFAVPLAQVDIPTTDEIEIEQDIKQITSDAIIADESKSDIESAVTENETYNDTSNSFSYLSDANHANEQREKSQKSSSHPTTDDETAHRADQTVAQNNEFVNLCLKLRPS